VEGDRRRHHKYPQHVLVELCRSVSDPHQHSARGTVQAAQQPSILHTRKGKGRTRGYPPTRLTQRDLAYVKAMPEWWWAEARNDYNHLATLTRMVDCHISSIVFLSFAIDLYFICIQLLFSFKYMLLIHSRLTIACSRTI